MDRRTVWAPEPWLGICLHFSICARLSLQWHTCKPKNSHYSGANCFNLNVAHTGIRGRGNDGFMGIHIDPAFRHFSQLTFYPTVTRLHPYKTTIQGPPQGSTPGMHVVNKEANLPTKMFTLLDLCRKGAKFSLQWRRLLQVQWRS